MNLVVNEWLLEYFTPGTPVESRVILKAFFDNIQSTGRKMVIGRETPFTAKYYRYMKLHGQDTAFKANYVRLNEVLFQDPLRTIIVETDEMAEVSDQEMSGVHGDDKYLLQLVRSIPDSMIVSTDSRLIGALAGNVAFPVIHLEKYLAGTM
jgi:hypothetical protein